MGKEAGSQSPTCPRWKQEDGGAKEETVKRRKELEKENGRLKRLVANLSLDKAILKEIGEGAGKRVGPARKREAVRHVEGVLEVSERRARVQDALHQTRQPVAERLQRKL